MTEGRLAQLEKVVLNGTPSPEEQEEIAHALFCLGQIVEWAYSDKKYNGEAGRGYVCAQLDVRLAMKEK